MFPDLIVRYYFIRVRSYSFQSELVPNILRNGIYMLLCLNILSCSTTWRNDYRRRINWRFSPGSPAKIWNHFSLVSGEMPITAWRRGHCINNMCKYRFLLFSWVKIKYSFLQLQDYYERTKHFQLTPAKMADYIWNNNNNKQRKFYIVRGKKNDSFGSPLRSGYIQTTGI